MGSEGEGEVRMAWKMNKFLCADGGREEKWRKNRWVQHGPFLCSFRRGEEAVQCQLQQELDWGEAVSEWPIKKKTVSLTENFPSLSLRGARAESNQERNQREETPETKFFSFSPFFFPEWNACFFWLVVVGKAWEVGDYPSFLLVLSNVQQWNKKIYLHLTFWRCRFCASLLFFFISILSIFIFLFPMKMPKI